MEKLCIGMETRQKIHIIDTILKYINLLVGRQFYFKCIQRAFSVLPFDLIIGAVDLITAAVSGLSVQI